MEDSLLPQRDQPQDSAIQWSGVEVAHGVILIPPVFVAHRTANLTLNLVVRELEGEVRDDSLPRKSQLFLAIGLARLLEDLFAIEWLLAYRVVLSAARMQGPVIGSLKEESRA